MSILDDISNAILAYPHERLVLEIVEVDFPGGVIDRNEDVQFRVQVTNTGTLDVNELDVLVEGLNGTLVKGNGAAAQYASSFTTSNGYLGTVPAHSPNDPVASGGGKFFFKPTTSSTVIKDLVRVSVAGWDTTFDHPLINHSRADAAANGVFRSAVSPT